MPVFEAITTPWQYDRSAPEIQCESGLMIVTERHSKPIPQPNGYLIGIE